MQNFSFSAPLLLGGSAKILYDVLLFRSFRALKPPEELEPAGAQATQHWQKLGLGLCLGRYIARRTAPADLATKAKQFAFCLAA